jgi:hypothetical protein
MSRFSLPIPIAALAAGCPGDDTTSDDGGSGPATSSATAGDDSGTAATSGAPSSCSEAQTEEACGAIEAGPQGGCSWVTVHTVEIDDGGQCVFSSPQGTCLAAVPGDTDCEGNDSDCGLSTWVQAGTPAQIIVASSGLACGAELPPGFAECNPAAGVVDAECECGCADNLPQ